MIVLFYVFQQVIIRKAFIINSNYNKLIIIWINIDVPMTMLHIIEKNK